MFEAGTYIERRRALAERVGSGILLFVGNDLTPMNYEDNPYPFWQDRSFLYYWGLDEPGLVGVLDARASEERLYALREEELRARLRVSRTSGLVRRQFPAGAFAAMTREERGCHGHLA